MSRNFEQNRSHYKKSRIERQDNALERLITPSGNILVIDQFMLSNQQFLTRSGLGQRDKLDLDQVSTAAKMYGGQVINLPIGHYNVVRDLSLRAIILLKENIDFDFRDFEDFIAETKAAIIIGEVYIDTRCLVFIDLEKLVGNSLLLENYQKLRQKGEDKKARDLLRNHGAAVRYGFDPLRDQLHICQSTDKQIVTFTS